MVHFRWVRAVGIAAVLALAAGCGTRLTHDQVVTAAGGGPVRLSPETLSQLGSDIARLMPPTAAPGQAGPAVLSGHRIPGPRASPRRQKSGGVPGPVPVPDPSRRAAPSALPAGPSVCPALASPVTIGQVGTFSGVAGPITAGARTMVAAWAADLNSRGGLNCHPVRVYSEDDGGDPQRAAADVKDLVEVHHAAALVGNLVPFSVSGFRAAVESAKVPAIGGESGTSDFYQSPFFFPTGASAEDQALGAVRNGVQAGHRKVAVFYCVESPGCTGIGAAVEARAADSAGAQVVQAAPVSLVQPDYTAECLNARKAGADLLSLAMDGASMLRMARSCLQVGYRPVLAAVATQLSAAQSDNPDLRTLGMLTATPTAPWPLSDNPGLAEYHRVLARFAPGAPADAQSMLGWVAGRLLQQAVARAAPPGGGAITATVVLDGLAMVHQDTLDGLTGPLTFQAGEAHATSNGCVFYESLTDAGWTAREAKPICQPHRA